MGWAATGIGFNSNLLDLLPEDAESLQYQRRMIMESRFSPLAGIVTADDLEALEELRDRSDQEDSIARFDSVLQFLPQDAGASPAALRELARLLERIRLPESARPLDRARLARSLRKLEEQLIEATEAAFGAGLGVLAGAFEGSRSEAALALESVEHSSTGAEDGWNDGQRRLLAWAGEALESLRAAAASEPPSTDTLPEPVQERFVTRSGRFLGFLQPAGNVFDPGELNAFVSASRRVSGEVTGFPIVFHAMSARITSGFSRAVILGAVLMALVLLVDLRSVRSVLLASIPLVLGLVWMLGGMRLLGISYNFANLVAVPLILGVGIDNGVHVIHRMRLEGCEGMSVVLRHTGRAILMGSLTTMIGFGSLALAEHRGLASLGIVLILGVGSCLVTSTVVLPNLLVALRIARR
jgi:hypothetical protein